MADCVYASRDMVRIDAGGSGCCGNTVDVRRCLSSDQPSEYCVADRDFDGSLYGVATVGDEQKRIGAVSCQRCAFRSVPVELLPLPQHDEGPPPLWKQMWMKIHTQGRAAHVDGVVVINCDHDGYGDACLAAWIARGHANSEPRVLLYASGAKKEFLELLGMDVLPTLPSVWRSVHAINMDKNIGTLTLALGIAAKWQRPVVRIPSHGREWAVEHLARDRVAVLAPRSVNFTREWSIARWKELAERLHGDGFLVTIVGDSWCDQRYIDVPIDWGITAAAMSQAAIVVCNDSGPMHLAGTIGVPTLAVLGPTTPHIAAHMPSVRCVSQQHRIMPCTGCWWTLPNFTVERCGTGCVSLQSLSVESVANEIAIHLDDMSRSETVKIDGVWVRTNFLEQDMVLVREVIVRDCYRISQMKTAPKTIVDVGAHIGCFAVLAHERWKDAKIVCVEANAKNAVVLKQNVSGFADVVEAACTHIDGDVVLLNSVIANCASTGGSVVVPHSAAVAEMRDRVNRDEYQLDAKTLNKVTLKELIAQCGGHIDLLKMDCEGCEFSVLDSDDIASVSCIVGEYHHTASWHALLKKRFGKWKYQVHHHDSTGLGMFTLENSDGAEGHGYTECLRKAVDGIAPHTTVVLGKDANVRATASIEPCGLVIVDAECPDPVEAMRLARPSTRDVLYVGDRRNVNAAVGNSRSSSDVKSYSYIVDDALPPQFIHHIKTTGNYHLQIALPPGIGDSVWCLTKVPAMLKKYGLSKAEIAVCSLGESDVDRRAAEFVSRFNFVQSGRHERLSVVESQQFNHDGTINYSVTQPRWHEKFDWLLQANSTLERGERLETWLPDYETDWDIADKFVFNDADKAINVSEPYGILYYGPLEGNTVAGHNRGTLWTPEQWGVVASQMRQRGLRVVVIGAVYDRSYAEVCMPHCGECIDLVGKTTVGQCMNIIRNAECGAYYQSGLGVMSCYFNVPTAMWWRRHGDSILSNEYVTFSEDMATGWVAPHVLANGTYHPLIYGRDDEKTVCMKLGLI